MVSKPKATGEKNKGGRPCYEPNDYDRGKLEAFIRFGMTENNIAAAMGKSINTLKKYYPESFENCRADAHQAVEAALFYQATVLNIPASTIFFLKTQLERYQEKRENTDKVDNAAVLKLISDKLPV